MKIDFHFVRVGYQILKFVIKNILDTLSTNFIRGSINKRRIVTFFLGFLCHFRKYPYLCGNSIEYEIPNWHTRLQNRPSE